MNSVRNTDTNQVDNVFYDVAKLTCHPALRQPHLSVGALHLTWRGA